MRKRAAAIILTVMVFFSGSAWALGPLDMSADVAFMSKYAWRGIVLNDDPVFQPSVTLGLGGFSFNVWGNMDFTDFNDMNYEFTEIDYTMDYTMELPAVSLSFGALRYGYSIPGWDSTVELYLGAEAALPGSPALMIYQDVDKGEGTYVELGAAQSLPVAPFASLELSAMLGWGSGMHNRYNYAIAGMDGGFTDISLNLGLPIGIGEMISVTPSASFISCLHGDLRKNYDKSIVVFGLSASASF